jgi:HEAT repeat protein
MMPLLVILWSVCVAQPEASPPVPQPLESAMSQPADEADKKPTDEAGQIEDAARLIVGDHTSQARRIGVRTLLRIGSSAAIERLTTILVQANEGNSAARSAIFGVLSESEAPPSALLAPLIDLVGESKGNAMDGIRAALAAYPQAEAQKALCNVARDSQLAAPRRVAIIEMIGRLGEDYSAAGALAGLMTDENAEIRGTALRAFVMMTGVEFDDGGAATRWWQEHAGLGELKWLARSNQRRREELRALHAERDALEARLVAAYRAAFLALADKDRDARLVAFLKDDVADVRKLGLDLIASMIIDQKEVSKDVRDAIVPLLADADAELRRQSAMIAGNLRIGAATDGMIASLSSDPSPRVRAALAGALGRLDDPRAIRPLVKCLESDDRELVGEATLALGSLARRGNPELAEAAFVATSLEARFNTLASDDDELREKFLRAMSRIGDESFLSIIKRESVEGRNSTIRTIAILGLAAFDSGNTAEFLTTLLTDDAALVRAAAAQSLGKCGRTKSHFNAVFGRTRTDQESDASVRDKAWDAAQSMFARLSGTVRLEILFDLGSIDDATVQRHRAALARALKADRDATNELTAAKRMEVALILGDSLLRAGEHVAALTELQDVAQYRSEFSNDLVNRMDTGLVSSAMRASKFDEVVKFLVSAMSATSEMDKRSKREALQNCFDEELVSCLANAKSGTEIAALAKLMNPAVTALGVEDPEGALARKWNASIASRRDAMIDELLELETGESSVAQELQKFETPAVIARIHAKLAAMKQTTSGPAAEREAALIALARQFVPGWAGYDPGNSVEERSKALDQLIAG